MNYKVKAVITCFVALLLGVSQIGYATPQSRKSTRSARTTGGKRTAGTSSRSTMSLLEASLSKKPQVTVNSTATLDRMLTWAKTVETKYGDKIKSGIRQTPEGKWVYKGTLRGTDEIERYYDYYSKLNEYIAGKYNGAAVKEVEGRQIACAYAEFMVFQHINDLLAMMPSEPCKTAFKKDIVSLLKFIEALSKIVVVESGSSGSFRASISASAYEDIAMIANDFLYELWQAMKGAGSSVSEAPGQMLPSFVNGFTYDSESMGCSSDEYHKAKTAMAETATEFVEGYTQWLDSYPDYPRNLLNQPSVFLKDLAKKFDITLTSFTSSSDRVYETAEQDPLYPGGMVALYRWVSDNVGPLLKGVEGHGRVKFEFIIEPDCSISNVTVTKGIHPDLDKEIVAVVEKMPKWQVPARMNGKPVRLRYSLPVFYSN